jgi:phage terminase large subunit
MKRGYKETFLVLRKTAPAARKSVFVLLKKYIQKWGITKVTKINETEMKFTFQNSSEIYCCGIDDPEKIKSIEGVTSIWLEEPTELKDTDFRQIDLRLRGDTPSYKQIIMSFNPISRLSWLHKLFFEKKRDKAITCHTTYRDNRFIDEEYKEIIENLKSEDENYYSIYGLGEWGVLKHIIYQNWIEEEIPIESKYYDSVLSGLDFGFNHPSALVMVGIKDNELYIFDELYEKGKTNNQLIYLVKKKVPSSQIITADSAEPARIKEFKQSGVWVKASVKGKGSVKDGIDWVKRHKIHIHPQCVNTIKEIQGYKYKEDKDGNVLDEPVPFNDDAMSALRYAVEELVEAPLPGFFVVE